MNEAVAQDLTEVKKSLGRCLLNAKHDKRFLERFYEIFLASHPAIKDSFANTNFEKQLMALKNGLNMAILYAEGDTLAEDVLKQIQVTHNRTHMAIDPKLYPHWSGSLMKTIEEFDERLNEETKVLWEYVLKTSIDYIVSEY